MITMTYWSLVSCRTGSCRAWGPNLTKWGMTFILEWCVVMTLDSNWPLYILINSVSLTIQGPTRNRLERGRLAFD